MVFFFFTFELKSVTSNPNTVPTYRKNIAAPMKDGYKRGLLPFKGLKVVAKDADVQLHA